jgi:hypothetical protein
MVNYAKFRYKKLIMANSEHLEILEKGLEAWNNWRDENPNGSISTLLEQKN